MKNVVLVAIACLLCMVVQLAPAQLLYDNGPLITHPGGGFNGADTSALQSGLLNLYGSNMNVTTFKFTDDFNVTSVGGWAIDSIQFFGYQTVTTPVYPPVSTFTGMFFEIYNGDPSAGGTLVFGNIAVNTMIRTGWTNIYRALSTTLTNAQRAIMVNTVSVGTVLPSGTYWLVWNASGSLASGPWQPPITILGQQTTGNAHQWTGAAWQGMRDSIPGAATGYDQGVPFKIYGTALGSAVKDIFVKSVNLSPASPNVGSPVTVSAKIKNLGSEANPASVPMTYKIGSAPATYGDGTAETFTPPSWVGDSATVTFTTTYTPSVWGTFTVYVKSFYPGDEVASNDLSSGSAFAVPAVDLGMTDFWQTSGFPTPLSAIAFGTGNERGITEAAIGSSGEIKSNEADGSAPADVAINRNSVRVVRSESINNPLLANINLRASVRNDGFSASTYTLNWAVQGTPQAPYSGPSVAGGGGTDTASLTYSQSVWGTYLATSKVAAVGDPNPNNDSIAARLRIYPTSFSRTMYDTSLLETYIGWGVTTRAMTACVRYTAPAEIRLLGAEMVYRTESLLSGTITVKVRAAGGSNDSVGPVLYTKTFTTPDYFTGPGDIVFLPFDSAAAPVISSGANYWIQVRFPVGIPYPGGAQNTGFTIGHSYYEATDDTLKLTPLIITTERCWILRSVHMPTTTTVTVNVPVALGWNILGLPVSNPIPDDSVKHIYVNSINPYGFAYVAGYQQRYTMANGIGYWIKSSAAYTQSITGNTIGPIDGCFPIATGWNMPGGISSLDVAIGDIVWTPDTRVSSYFIYNNGYLVATTIPAGKGFWVKSSGVSQMCAPSLSKVTGGVANTGRRSIEELNSLTVTDSKGGSQTLYFGADETIPVSLYAMPPLPPVGAFDARFETSEGGSMVQTHGGESAEFTVAIQSDAYPVTVTWNVKDASYALTAGAGSVQVMRGEGTMKISNSEVNRLFLKLTGAGELPKEYALSQNYPNPFNPTTGIKYALPVDSKVTMEIYNIVGQRVRTLVNDNMPAGYHVAEWDGTGTAGQQLASGVYFLQMSATGTNGKSFNELRKLMMLK